jgi:hypothetical protein
VGWPLANEEKREKPGPTSQVVAQEAPVWEGKGANSALREENCLEGKGIRGLNHSYYFP